jgi:potassium/hydrogen antiporter
MDAFADFFPYLLVFAVLLLAAIALTPMVEAVGLPGPAAFLAVGIVAGYLDVVPTDRLGALPLEQIGAVALYGILFQGGLATGYRAWRTQAGPILALGTAGTAASAGLLAAAAHYVLGLDWTLAALVAVALSPTDPAAVYATFRGRDQLRRARVVLEGESGFNDPVSISLMVAVVTFVSSDQATLTGSAVHLLRELGLGLAGGLVGTAVLIAILKATPRLEEALQSIAILVTVVVIGAATASLHGSGFLAVYVAGLLFADRWSGREGTQHAIPAAVSAAAEPVLFGLLGAVYTPRLTGAAILDGVLLTLATVCLVRPAIVLACLSRSRFSRTDKLVVTVGGLKGAVPLLLAGYAALEALPEADRTEAIVLAATATSILAQGWGLTLITRRVTP